MHGQEDTKRQLELTQKKWEPYFFHIFSPLDFSVLQMLKQADQEQEEQLTQRMKDILEVAMGPMVQPNGWRTMS